MFNSEVKCLPKWVSAASQSWHSGYRSTSHLGRKPTSQQNISLEAKCLLTDTQCTAEDEQVAGVARNVCTLSFI